MGATEDSKKELIAEMGGYPECEASWNELLSDLNNRCMKVEPKLAVGVGCSRLSAPGTQSNFEDTGARLLVSHERQHTEFEPT